MTERVIEDPVLKQRLSFRRTTDEGGGEVLHIEMWVDPGGGAGPHVHPAMDERFEVVSGRPSFLSGRKWREAGPGEVVVVPAGVRHAYRNDGDELAHVRCEARPPSLLQEFLEDVAGLSRAGRITRLGLPKSPTGLLQGAVLLDHYREMAVIGFPLPPPVLQRLLVAPLAWLGRRRGYRAGSFAELAAG